MPYAKNKIIINTGRVNGRNADIHAAHEVLLSYGDEMEINDWLKHPEAIAFKERMEKFCAAYDPAQAAYRDECWQLADDMRQFMDKMLAQKP
jgi:hypothetical protein